MNKLAHLLFIHRSTRDGTGRPRQNLGTRRAREWFGWILRPRICRSALGCAGSARLRSSERSAQKAHSRKNHRPLEFLSNTCPEWIHGCRFPPESRPHWLRHSSAASPHRERNCRFLRSLSRASISPPEMCRSANFRCSVCLSRTLGTIFFRYFFLPGHVLCRPPTVLTFFVYEQAHRRALERPRFEF
jgi:hypothetical protein